MSKVRAVSVAVLAGVAVLAVAVLTGAGGSAVSLPYRDADRVAEGRAIYAAHCAACHGADLQGEADWRNRNADGLMPAPPHDETGHTWHHADAVLFDLTKRGTAAVVGGGYQSNMPGFAGVLSDAEILSVLGYIKSTWPQQVIETHNRINRDAKAARGMEG